MNERGFSLIIVIFIIVLIGGLGWTLAVMQSGDSEANLRMFNTEKAMFAAESGLNWALNVVSLNANNFTDTDNDTCNDTADWITHTLPGAQYRVCIRPANVTEAQNGDVAIQAEGYVPAYANYQVMRRTKAVVGTGEFNKVAQAHALFDWSQVDKNNSYFRGPIQALYYSGDGDSIYNEDGADYRNGTHNELPRGNNDDTRTVAAEPFPIIIMSAYEAAAGTNVWGPYLVSTVASTELVDAGTRTELTLTSAPGADWVNQVCRNMTMGTCAAGTWQTVNAVSVATNKIKLDGVVQWQPGDRIVIAVRPSSVTYDRESWQEWEFINHKWQLVTHSRDLGRYTLTFPVRVCSSSNVGDVLRRLIIEDTAASAYETGSWSLYDWGVIRSVSGDGRTIQVYIDSGYAGEEYDLGQLPDNDKRRWDSAQWSNWFVPAHRFRGDQSNHAVMYLRMDTVIDVRDPQEWEDPWVDTSSLFNKSGVVSEGDVLISGPNMVSFTKKPLQYPNLATKNGAIICTDLPAGSSISRRLRNRNWDDCVFSENGDVRFNYIDATGVFGRNIYLSGVVHLQYDASAVTRLTGYTFSLAGYKWKEQ